MQSLDTQEICLLASVWELLFLSELKAEAFEHPARGLVGLEIVGGECV